MNFYQLNEMHFGENHGAMWSSPLRLDRLLASLGQCSPGVLLYFLRNDVVRAGDVVIAPTNTLRWFELRSVGVAAPYVVRRGVAVFFCGTMWSSFPTWFAGGVVVHRVGAMTTSPV